MPRSINLQKHNRIPISFCADCYKKSKRITNIWVKYIARKFTRTIRVCSHHKLNFDVFSAGPENFINWANKVSPWSSWMMIILFRKPIGSPSSRFWLMHQCWPSPALVSKVGWPFFFFFIFWSRQKICLVDKMKFILLSGDWFGW